MASLSYEEEIWASALVLVQGLGEMASIRASQNADLCLEEGDVDGHTKWMKILKAVDQLLEEGLDRPH